MNKYLLVFIGGGIGSVLRFGLNTISQNKTFPLSTFIANVSGSFLIGLLFAYFIKSAGTEHAKLFLITGFCGGFTTFSAFSLENLLLLQKGDIQTAILYIIGTFMLTLLAVYIGFYLGKEII